MDESFREKPFIKEKLSRLIVEIAKRDWPQRWLSFLDDLLVLLEDTVRESRKRRMTFRKIRVGRVFFFSLENSHINVFLAFTRRDGIECVTYA